MTDDTPAAEAPQSTGSALPEPVAWFRAPYGTLEPNPLFRVTGPQSLEWAVACFTEDQLRAAVAAERAKLRGALLLMRERLLMENPHAVTTEADALLLGPNSN
jgi:hypothetical protein